MYNNKKTAQFNWQVLSFKCDCMFVSIQNSQIYYDITTIILRVYYTILIWWAW